MNPNILWVVVAVIAVLIIAALVYVANRQRQSKLIRDKFGPEYDYAVKKAGGDTAHAEAELRERAARVEQYRIRPLSATERDRFSQDWRAIQSMFVDQPEIAVQKADKMIGEVMHARGYPVGDFEQRTSDISVDHPGAVSEYRVAHGLTVARERGEDNTENLRQAMVHYRNLFEELVMDRPAASTVREEERRDQA